MLGLVLRAEKEPCLNCYSIAEADLDHRRGALLVRRGKGGRRGEVGMDMAVAELALDDDERHAFARHFERVGVPQLATG